MPLEDHPMRPTLCPNCKAEMIGAFAESSDGVGPQPNNVCVCANCAAALVFTDDLELRFMTRADLEKLEPDDALQLGRFQAAAFMRLQAKVLH